jgi:hypothetical protein
VVALHSTQGGCAPIYKNRTVAAGDSDKQLSNRDCSKTKMQKTSQKAFSNSTPIKQTKMQKAESIISEDFDTSMSWDSAGSGYASVDFTELPFEPDSTCSSLESSIEIVESEIIDSSCDDEIMEESFADLMEELLELCVDDTPWNHFSKMHHIGQGSSGTVFLSESPTGEKVAIKEIILKKLKNKQLLLNEICAMQNIVHPNLLPLNEAFIYEDAVDSQLKVAIVTPFAELGNLIRFCKKTRHSEKLTALILRQVLQGLSELHRNSIAHRDIKSDNVFLKKDGTVFLSDFGFCDVADEEGKCAGNSVIGTPYWMAPEGTVINYL